MPSHVGLLRGINVGGRNKLAMAGLRRVVGSLGHTEVTTYIQSGNVLFNTADTKTSTANLARAMELAIAEQLEVHPAVVVVARNAMRQVVRDNPFAHESNPKAIHAVFLPSEHTPDDTAAVAAAVARARAKGRRDDAILAGHTLYMWTPDGMGRSELAAQLNRVGSSGAAALTGTARNWATVTKLAELLDA